MIKEEFLEPITSLSLQLFLLFETLHPHISLQSPRSFGKVRSLWEGQMSHPVISSAAGDATADRTAKSLSCRNYILVMRGRKYVIYGIFGVLIITT